MKQVSSFGRQFRRKSKEWRSIGRYINSRLVKILNLIIPSFLFVCALLVLYDIGFREFRHIQPEYISWLSLLLRVILILMTLRLVFELAIPRKVRVRLFSLGIVLFASLLTFVVIPALSEVNVIATRQLLFLKLLLSTGIVLLFITEFSHLLQLIYEKVFNAGYIFVGSFVFLIGSGALLLKLPQSTLNGISLIDALFTATSAVCVTGLTVVDTATEFTRLGQIIIMLLIQVGGLGMMTFAGLLAYAVSGHASIRTQLAFKDMMNTNRLANVMHQLYKVILVTFFFEAIGAVCIYLSLDDQLFGSTADKIFFSCFHAISAFCNAGFSTYSNNLYEPAIRFNYLFQMLVAWLIILGGLGFPAVFGIYRYFKVSYINAFRAVTRNRVRVHIPRLSYLSTRLALIVSAIMISIGFIAFILFEQESSLIDHPTLTGKLVTSFFGSVTARTAGFNAIDMTKLTLPMVMIYLLLMYVGASPGSTGGGIKTTTVGVAALNCIAIFKGRDRIHFQRSEISQQSVQRAFAIIALSLICISTSVFFVSMYDSGKGLISIAFEVFSAFSTTGLSLGITPHLTTFSKLVLIITMFVGRVGIVTLLVAFIKQSKTLYYRYPTQDIMF